MQLVDRIEKRRFVGRELLLWLWFESEIREGTLATDEHGEIALWLERQIVLSEGKEVTRIKGAQPAGGREAKEALLRGKMPEMAGLHLTWREQEWTWTLKAEQVAFSGLKLPTVLGAAEDAPVVAEAPRPPPKKKRKSSAREDAEAASDEEHEAFYERMHLTRDAEAIFEALYREFLGLRLGPSWDAVVVPAMRAWAAGEEVDAERYLEEKRAGRGAGARRAAKSR